MRYIALLRGINVSGQRTIKMADLRSMLEALEFKNVKTYVQSGNAAFDYEPADTVKLADVIGDKIAETFGFPVKIIIRTARELEGIVKNNPFLKDTGIDTAKLHITFLSDDPEPDATASLEVKKEENERFLIVSREVYLYCPNGYGNTKLNNALFEKKLKTAATTRNWKTVNCLHEL
ncbi:MAG: DUF1697 domain-containing protein [Bacillota bacterium]|nr:DUF1697 domain-containing protein [Bacillota bacterium]